MLLMLVIFRYDTPVMLKRTGQTEKLNELMNKIYKSNVEEQISLIAGGDEKDENQ